MNIINDVNFIWDYTEVFSKVFFVNGERKNCRVYVNDITQGGFGLFENLVVFENDFGADLTSLVGDCGVDYMTKISGIPKNGRWLLATGLNGVRLLTQQRID